jgi:hypothetical protein
MARNEVSIFDVDDIYESDVLLTNINKEFSIDFYG